MAQDSTEDSGMDLDGLLLPEKGIEELTDKLTGYMTEIELGGLSDIIGQVLDDFLDQCGGMSEDSSILVTPKLSMICCTNRLTTWGERPSNRPNW